MCCCYCCRAELYCCLQSGGCYPVPWLYKSRGWCVGEGQQSSSKSQNVADSGHATSSDWCRKGKTAQFPCWRGCPVPSAALRRCVEPPLCLFEIAWGYRMQCRVVVRVAGCSLRSRSYQACQRLAVWREQWAAVFVDVFAEWQWVTISFFDSAGKGCELWSEGENETISGKPAFLIWFGSFLGTKRQIKFRRIFQTMTERGRKHWDLSGLNKEKLTRSLPGIGDQLELFSQETSWQQTWHQLFEDFSKINFFHESNVYYSPFLVAGARQKYRSISDNSNLHNSTSAWFDFFSKHVWIYVCVNRFHNSTFSSAKRASRITRNRPVRGSFSMLWVEYSHGRFPRIWRTKFWNLNL